MTTLQKLLTSASVATLLATSVAAQEGNTRVGEPESSTEEMVSTDTNLEAQTEDNLDMTGETIEEATAPGADMPATELDFGFSTNVAMAIAGAKLDADSSLVGHNIVTREGKLLGDVTEVYVVEGQDSYLVVNLDERLNLAADKFLVRLGATEAEGRDLKLASNEIEFTNALEKASGIETIEAN